MFTTKAGSVTKVILCGCDCHTEITSMYEVAGIPREWPEGIWTPEEMKLRRENGDALDPEILRECIEASRSKAVIELVEEDKAPVPVLADRTEEVKTLDGILPPNPFVEDPNKREAGYRPRGQLNFDVKIACDGYFLGAYPDIEVLNCTKIAQLIDPQSPPSTGAITNVLRRWSKYGFAVIEEAPLRFVTYTQAGLRLGYDELERNYKAGESNRSSTISRQKARAQADLLRTGIRSPRRP
ncbi:hypothetical protein AB0F25_30680 [Streptomyces wedmorensis]|uniref:hypothetical protein n=1 Tax=Streptomyces wedmorensis TaxID=43759 RepID=UPI00342C7389